MDDCASPIPPSLLARINALRDLLMQEGSVQLHHGENRRQKYRLRYRSNPSDGQRIHCSLELGPESVAYAVQELLREWRKRSSEPQFADKKAHSEEYGKVIKECIRLQAKAAGASPSYQAKIGKMYDAAMKGTAREAYQFLFNGPYLNPPKRGRPRKSRLW